MLLEAVTSSNCPCKPLKIELLIMTRPHLTQWSVEKQQRLERQLSGYWAADVWKIGACPLVKPEGLGKAYPNAAVRFEGISHSVKIELKYACWKKFTDRDWKADSEGHWFYLKPLINWLSQVAPHINSLLEKGLDEWEASLREFIVASDNARDPRRYVSTLRVIYAVLSLHCLAVSTRADQEAD